MTDPICLIHVSRISNELGEYLFRHVRQKAVSPFDCKTVS